MHYPGRQCCLSIKKSQKWKFLISKSIKLFRLFVFYNLSSSSKTKTKVFLAFRCTAVEILRINVKSLSPNQCTTKKKGSRNSPLFQARLLNSKLLPTFTYQELPSVEYDINNVSLPSHLLVIKWYELWQTVR